MKSLLKQSMQKGREREIQVVSATVSIAGYCGNSLSVNDKYRDDIFQTHLVPIIIAEVIFSLFSWPRFLMLK